MIPLIVNGPAIEPIALADMKQWLKLETSDDDDVVGALITAARLMVAGRPFSFGVPAMGNFYTDVILKSTWVRNPNAVCKDIAMLEPGMRAKVQAFIADAKSLNRDLRVMETYRSQARQSQLFREGKTQLSKVGCHGFGVAADLGLFIDGKKYDPRGQDYMFFQALCVKHKLISGIGWGTPHARHTFADYDHVQNVPIFRQGDLFAGRWYPPPDYDPIDDMIKHGVRGL